MRLRIWIAPLHVGVDDRVEFLGDGVPTQRYGLFAVHVYLHDRLLTGTGRLIPIGVLTLARAGGHLDFGALPPIALFIPITGLA